MKYLPRLSVAVLAIVGLVAISAGTAQAQTPELTDEQRTMIVTNCVSIKNTLNQLKATDALLRVNRGQVYEALSSKLMDRFNSRLSNNQLDTKGFVSLRTSYDEQLDRFRADYEQYARQLESAIRIDCANDPDAFHDAVASARTMRTVVHEDVKKLHGYIDDYRSGVVDFKTNFERLAGDE